ncbi:hypothetical protein ACKWTF_000512 [Chironomus riparius]
MSICQVLIIFFFVSYVSSQSAQDDKPFLRIVAPKFICDDPSKAKSNDTDSKNKLNIGLQTREGQRLKYKIAIDFTLLDGFKNQRHTLSIWKNVRELQAKFAVKNVSDEISLRNQIEIDALELTPQVIYTFKVIGYDENNRTSDEQNFTITYKGEKLQAVHSNVGDGVSLLLFGPESFYNDLEFLAVADVLFCDPINDFYYQWKIDGMPESFNDDYLSVRSSSLKLPPGLFDGNKLYEVVVTIFNNKSEALASLSLPIKVLSREINTQNVPADCSVGINKEVPFVTALYRNPVNENINVKWTCTIDEKECPNVFTNLSESLQVSAVFPNEGIYVLNADVSVTGSSKSSNTRVLADQKVIPHVMIKYFPQQPVSAVEPNVIVATILDLVPKCVAYWNIVTDDEKYAKPKNESLTNIGLVSIKDYEEHFLQELVDYDNNTLSKDTTLEIPADALFPDSMYKFRLNVICPEPITEMMAPTDRQNITTYYEIVFETNGPPVALPLLILPLIGTPMKDLFTFKTGAAKERQSDYPLKYSFGYQVDNLIINIGTFYEFQVARTQLPYSNEIRTFLQVTDNNNATVHVKGPTLRANKDYKFTKKEIEFKLSEVQGTLKRSEYSKTLNSATVLILTQRKYASEEDAKNYEQQVYEMLKTELDSLKSSKSSTFVHQQNVIEFVKMSKNLLSIMTVFDDNFVEDILSLTEAQSRRAKRLILSNSLRNKNIMAHDTDYIQNVLSLSDMLISSSNPETVQREKRKYVEKIHLFITSLCQDQYLNSHTIKSKFAAFEVSKIYSRQLYIKPQKFPNDTATAIYSSNPNFPSKFVCMGKIRFIIDMFNVSSKDNSESIVYETRIIDDDGSGNKIPVQSEIVSDYVVMEMPVKNGNANEQTCFTWSDNQWSSNECEQQVVNQSRIICRCKTLSDSAIIKYQKGLVTKPTTPTKVTTAFTFSPIRTEPTSSKTTGNPTTIESFGKGTTSSVFIDSTTVKSTDESSKASTTVKSTDESLKATTAQSAIMTQTESQTVTTTFESPTATLTTEQITKKIETIGTTLKSTNTEDNTDNPNEVTATIIPDIPKTTSNVDIPVTTPKADIPEITSTQFSSKSPLSTESLKPESSSSTENNQVTTKGYISTTESFISTSISTQATENSKTSLAMHSTSIQSTALETDKFISTKQMEASTKSTATESTKQMTVNNQKDVISEKPTTLTKQSTGKSKHETTSVTAIVTKESQGNTNDTSAKLEEANIGLNSWFVLLMLGLFFAIVIILILIHRCRRFAETYINLPMRQPSDSIKYAKYHDEFILRG